jgi:hypothetical protein
MVHMTRRSHYVVPRALISLAAATALSVGGLRAFADDSASLNGDDGFGRERYSIALFGDMPYNAIGKQQYPALLADINASHIVFSVFDGDMKAGGDGPCTDDNLYTPALANFAKLDRPLIWLPGDNDWTDCWGRYGAGTSAPGADDPIERLQHERDLFTTGDYSLGRHKLGLRVSRATAASTLSIVRTCAGSTAPSSTLASTCKDRTTIIPTSASTARRARRRRLIGSARRRRHARRRTFIGSTKDSTMPSASTPPA